MSGDGERYNLKVVTSHTLAIEWVFNHRYRNDQRFIDAFHNDLDAYWLSIRDDFPIVRNLDDRFLLGLAGYGRFKIAGDDPETVLAAGRQMARKIFSLGFVEPAVPN
jgi:hypothetical protein